MAKRGRKPGPAGSQRTFRILVRFRPQVKEAVASKLESLNLSKVRKTDKGQVIPWTLSELVREAVWEYCKPPGDPRQP